MPILTIAEIVVAVTIIVFILLQQRGTALGAAFGGGDGGGAYSTRRGIQQKLYWGTIVLTATFIILALLDLLI